MKKALLFVLAVMVALFVASCKSDETNSVKPSEAPVVSQQTDTDSATDTDSDDSLYKIVNGNIVLEYEDVMGYTSVYTYYFNADDMLTDIRIVTDYKNETTAEFNLASDSKNNNYKNVERTGTKVSKYYEDDFIDSIYERRSKTYILSMWEI